MSLYIRHRTDLPHAVSSHTPTSARCGVSLAGAVAITEEQARTFLGDVRCTGCFPDWSHKKRYETRG